MSAITLHIAATDRRASTGRDYRIWQMTDSNLRNVIPDVCANCINKRTIEPVWDIQHYYCDIESNYNARIFIWAQEQHYKTCDKFSVRLRGGNEP